MKTVIKFIAKGFVDRHFPRIGMLIRSVLNSLRASAAPSRHPQFGFQFAGNELMMSGRFEQEEVKVVMSLLPEVDRVLNIGANIGYYVCIARAVGRPCLAFEPMPVNLAILYANLRANNWQDTEVWPVGLADHVGMTMMFGDNTGASLIPGWAGHRNPLGTVICLNTLNNIVGDRFIDERLLVLLDVEGFELDVLRGGTQIFEGKIKPLLLIEISLELHHPEPNPNYLQTFEFLWDRGYRVFTADQARRELTVDVVQRWITQAKCEWGVYNWLAIPDDFVSN